MYGNEVKEGLKFILKSITNGRKRTPDWDTKRYPNIVDENKKETSAPYLLMQEGNDYVLNEVISKIDSAHHFHIDSKLIDVQEFLSKQFDSGKAAFMNDMAVDVNLPFDQCWIDYEEVFVTTEEDLERINLPNQENLDDAIYHRAEKISVLKHGILVENVPYNNQTFLRIIVSSTSYFGRGRIKWTAPPIIWYVKVGGEVSDEELDYFLKLETDKFPFEYNIPQAEIYIKSFMKSDAPWNLNNLFFIPVVTKSLYLITEADKKYMESSIMTSVFSIHVLNMFLLTLNCKNIEVVDNYHLKRRIGGKGKVKYSEDKTKYMYKTLVIVLPKTKKSSGNGSSSSDGETVKRKFHWQMGSYATYTEDKPLFGKREGRKPITGRFWRPAAPKGSPEEGVVVKDYVATKKKPPKKKPKKK